MRTLRLFVCSWFSWMVPLTLFAHPTATTEVALTFADEAVDVAMTCDADALVVKLEALAGAAMSNGALTPAARMARILALPQTLLDRIDLRVDEVRIGLTMTGVTAIDDQRIAVRLTGLVPRGALQATWRTSLVSGSYPVVIRRAGASGDTTEWLQGPQPSAAYRLDGASSSRSGRMSQYLALGFTHILPNGLDHILFVLGLFFLTTRRRAVLAQVTAFTIAHSITLGLTLYGIVSLPAAVVEPLIALSIAYVAFENLFTSELRPWRLALVFSFGLLHGMGFAEALSRLNLPRSEFLTTLVTFNVGVEAGQLAVIGAAALIIGVCAIPPARYRQLVVRPASAAIALAGVVWTIQRLFS
jgi:hypothetical protein